MPLDKPFTQLSAIDIESLIQNKVSENKKLEFKQQGPDANNETSKIKICQCISSFANTDGGIIIFGIKQNDEGQAIEIMNIEKSFDEFSLQLLNMARDRITPKIQPPILRDILVGENKVILAEILPSYNKPHFVNNNFVFYGRNNSGKYQLDVHEIRNLFLSVKSIEEQYEQFRVQRLMKIRSKSFISPPYSDSSVVIHFAPLSSFQNSGLLPLDKIKNDNNSPFYNLYKYGFSKCFNFDGLMFYSKFAEGQLSGYTQIFRDGRIEFVDFYHIKSMSEKEIHGAFVEQIIIEFIETIVPFMRKYEKDFPFLCSISLLNIQGSRLVTSGDRIPIHLFPNSEFQIISETDIVIPTVYIENPDDLLEKINYCTTIIWNSGGYDKNPN